MIIYKKNNQDFIRMCNTVRGVMKVPTAPFAKADRSRFLQALENALVRLGA